MSAPRPQVKRKVFTRYSVAWPETFDEGGAYEHLLERIALCYYVEGGGSAEVNVEWERAMNWPVLIVGAEAWHLFMRDADTVDAFARMGLVDVQQGAPVQPDAFCDQLKRCGWVDVNDLSDEEYAALS